MIRFRLAKRLANNDFLLVSRFSVTGALYTCRPDWVGFVTGLPRVYTPGLYQLKRAAVFEHVYESYPERDATVYAAAT